MRLVLVNDKLIGKTLETSIYHGNGQLFMSKGTVFTEKNIQAISNIGIATTYIEDNRHDISVQEVIEVTLKIKILAAIKELFNEIKTKNTVSESKVSNIVRDLIDNINLSENAFMINDVVDKDMELVVNSLRVCVLSIIIGIQKGYDKKRLTNLGMAALLFDIGKLVCGEEKHCEEGYRLVKKANTFPTTVYVGIYQHHENIDGTGAPQGLVDKEIHEFAKIIHICDDYLSLTKSVNANSINYAIEIMMMNSINLYGEEIYKDFINSVYCYPNGLVVKLSNGLDAVIVMQNKNFPMRPVVGVYFNNVPRLLNLMEHLSIFIKELIF